MRRKVITAVVATPSRPKGFDNSADVIEFRTTDTERGALSTVRANGGIASYLRSASIANNDKTASIISHFDTTVASSMNRVAEQNAQRHIRQALEAEIDLALGRIRPGFVVATAAIAALRGEHELRRARTLQFDSDRGAALRSDLRAWFASHNMPRRIALAVECDWNLGAALVEAGRAWSGLDADTWLAVEDQFCALNHAVKSGMESSHSVRPSVANMTGAGVDRAAVFSAASEAVKAWHREAELLDECDSYFRAVAAAVVLATGRPVEEVTGLK